MKRFTSTALALLVLAGTAQAIDIPVMKEGLWKLHMITSAPGEKTDDTEYYLCRSHAYDQSVKGIVDQAMKNCSTISDTTSLGKRYLNTTCKVAGSTLTSKAVIVAKGDTYYRTESHSTYSPPLYGETETNIIQEQTYVGACPAGMSPGDRKMQDGSIQRRH